VRNRALGPFDAKIEAVDITDFAGVVMVRANVSPDGAFVFVEGKDVKKVKVEVRGKILMISNGKKRLGCSCARIKMMATPISLPGDDSINASVIVPNEFMLLEG